jgi:hypothetical protein
MSDAAYAAHNKGGEQGSTSRERANNYIEKAKERFPGMANELGKYEVV